MQGHFLPASAEARGVPLYAVQTSGDAFRLWAKPEGGIPSLPGMVRASRLKGAMIGGGAATSWVHLAPFGEWKGHSSGKFSFNDEIFNQAIGNFDRLANAVPYTQGHPERDEPAPGWVRQLAVVGSGAGQYDGLYALTEWTASTAALIREGAWKFCSVFVRFASIDRQSNQPIGCELVQVGLTNNPFLDGQKPIALSRFGAVENTPMTPIQILVAFGTHAKLFAPGVKLDAVAEMTKAVAACAKALGMPKEPDVAKCIAACIKKLNGMASYLASETGDDTAPKDAEAAMASADAAKYAAAFLAMAKATKLADDGSGAPPPDQTEATPDEAAEGKLLDTLVAIMTKAGLTDTTSQQAALDANADAIASLLSNGGAPMAAEVQTQMSRKFAALETKLTIEATRSAALTAEVETLKADLAARTAAEAAAAKVAEETKLAAEKAAVEAKLAAEKVEADTLINAAVTSGALKLKATRDEKTGALTKTEAGSEVEQWRKLFALDHATAKEALALRVPTVPTPAAGPVAHDGSHPPPPPLVVEADKISLKLSDLSAAEQKLIRGSRGNPDLCRRLIANWREKQKLAADGAS